VADELQRAVDMVARLSGAPTLLEDRSQRMVTFCAQNGEIDEVRRASILRRRASPDIVEWYAQFGIHSAVEPLRVPACPEKGHLGRLCIPVRYQERLLGFLWLIDHENRLSDSEVLDVAAASAPIGLIMYRAELEARMEADVVNHLLSPSQELRHLAVQDIADGELLKGSAYVVGVVQPVNPGVESAGILADALWELGLAQPSRSLLRVARRDHAAIVVSLADTSTHSRKHAREVIATARRIVASQLTGDGSIRTVAALGTVQGELVDVATSYHQARLAAGVSGAISSMGDITDWETLGVFRAFALLPSSVVNSLVVDPRLRAIIDDGDVEVLQTLETYLDNAGSVKRTADSLFIHRATLYYRLGKAEKLAGMNLQDGETRLALHLGFKLLRLIGSHPLAAGQHPSPFAELAAVASEIAPLGHPGSSVATIDGTAIDQPA